MPRRTDISSILVMGAGPIIIVLALSPPVAFASPASAARHGPWQVGAQCDFAPPEECMTIMKQVSANIDIRIIRTSQRFELNAAVRRCDPPEDEEDPDSYVVKLSEWEAKPRKERYRLVTEKIAQWTEIALENCATVPANRRLSMAGFRKIFTAFDR